MEQSGFRPEDEANHQGASYGWQRLLAGLEQVLAGQNQGVALGKQPTPRGRDRT